jgi:class 3 adenylate cyclase
VALRLVTALAPPIALVVVLRAAPGLDARWEDQPAHFWIVLVAGVVNAGLAVAVSEAGRRRKDARLLLIGLAFLASAGFLGLHALATPGVLLEKGNAGFVLATPVGLVVAGLLAAASAVEYPLPTALALVRRARALVGAVLGVLALWALFSLAELPPLRAGVAPQDAEAALGAFAVLGVAAYGFAAVQYFRIAARRRSRLASAIAFAFALLAESLVIVLASLTTSWQLSWWEWHVLMAVSFFAIAAAAQREWFEERFSALYLDETLAGRREVTVLFADLSGFTPFSEAHGPEAVHAMLTRYFGVLAPMIVDDFDGEVQDFVGDQIFAIFNKRGDQPDHALRGARAALELQRRAEEIREPDWPRFRCGVNTGPVLAGVVGDRGHRIHGVFGDTVNLGSRLEGQAPPGGIVIAGATRDHLPDAADVEPLPPLAIKGKAAPVQAFILRGL